MFGAKTISLALGVSSLSFLASATALPPILDNLPRCDYQLIETFSDSKRDKSWETELTEKSTALRKDTLVYIQQQAAKVGADAILLQKFATSKSLMEGRTRARLGSEYSLTLSFSADLIKNCEENTRLALQAAPFNSQGDQIQGRFSLSAPTEIRTIIELKVPSSEPPPSFVPEINAEQGFYQLLPGASTAELQNRFGPASAQLVLADNSVLLGYGRQHWFWFVQDKLTVASQQLEPLPASIRFLIAEDSRFDNPGAWQLAGQTAHQLTSDQIIQRFPQTQRQAGNTLRHKTAQGYLHFYLSNNDTLRAMAYSKAASIPALPPLSSLNNALQSELLTQLNTSRQLAPLMALAPQLAQNQLQLEDNEQLLVLTPYLQLKVAQQRVTEVLLQLGAPEDAALQQHIATLLAQLELPATEQAFLARYPDAFSAAGELSWFGERQQVRLFFDNADRLYQAEIKLF